MQVARAQGRGFAQRDRQVQRGAHPADTLCVDLGFVQRLDRGPVGPDADQIDPALPRVAQAKYTAPVRSPGVVELVQASSTETSPSAACRDRAANGNSVACRFRAPRASHPIIVIPLHAGSPAGLAAGDESRSLQAPAARGSRQIFRPCPCLAILFGTGLPFGRKLA